MPRSKKNANDSVPPKTKKSPARPTADKPKAARLTGLTTGLTVDDLWKQMLEKNEKVEEADRLTDDEIVAFMKSEFPSAARSMVLNRIDIARSKYNRGGFHKKDASGKLVRPKIRSRPHGESASPSPSSRDFRSRTGPNANRGAGPRHKKDFKSHKK